MSATTELKNRLANDVFKRGIFKGDAPMESRRKTHFRVRELNNGDMAVRFHNTDIITVDQHTNNIILNCNGYEDSHTTRWAVAYSLRMILPGQHLGIGSQRFKGISHTVLFARNGSFLYYDGCVLSPEGDMISAQKHFRGKRMDKQATARLANDIEESGFKDMFRILWGSCDDSMMRGVAPSIFRHWMTNSEHADQWASIVAYAAYEYEQRNGVWQYVKQSPSEAWSALMRTAKHDMYEIYDTEVTNLRDI